MKTLITPRFPGRIGALGNEDPPAGAPAAGQVITAPPAGLESAANASATLATLSNTRLTSYVTGMKPSALEGLAEFLAPYVTAAIKFDYVEGALANKMPVGDDDQIGINGLPAVVSPDPDSTTSAQLRWRGLETPWTQNEQDVAAAQGMGMQAQERKAAWLRRMLVNGRASRVLAAYAAAAGNGTSVDFSADNDPIEALKTHITTVAEACGDRNLVRVLFGSTAWTNLTSHVYLTGGGNFARQIMTKARIAEMLELPEANIMVSYHQVVTSAQGKTTTKGKILTATNIYVFCAQDNATADDPSTAKTFYQPFQGQVMAAYEYQTHPLVKMMGIAYYELVKMTFTDALIRLIVSTT